MKIGDRAINVFAVIVGVIGIGVAVYFGFRQTPQKAVTWFIDARGDLVDINESIQNQGQIEVLFNGIPAENIQFVAMSFTNNGGIPLQKSDFVTPLSLDFGEAALIYSIDIIQKQPSSLEVSIAPLSKPTFEIPLLNANESFSIQIVGSNLQIPPNLGGRIVGISDIVVSERTIQRQEDGIRISNYETLFLLVCVIIGSYTLVGNIMEIFFPRRTKPLKSEAHQTETGNKSVEPDPMIERDSKS